MADSVDVQQQSEVPPVPAGAHETELIAAATGEKIHELTSFNPLEQRLHERREHGEISQDALPFAYINDLFSDQMCPVMRVDLDTGTVPQAVVLTRNQVDMLGCFVFVNEHGIIEVINTEMMQSDKLILFPEDFGTMDAAMANKDFLRMFPNGLGVVE